MIHLDTNYLIGLLVKGSPQSGDVDGWLATAETLATSAISWTEFLNGPVTPLEVSRVEAVLQSRILPFGQQQAILAADLFNKTGRRRGCRFDCLIAATAILAQAEVATVNQSDFQVFVPHGLKLAIAPPSPRQSHTASQVVPPAS
jgi:predicted nucleic acid-binding protein